MVVDKKTILKELEKVVDPEINVPMTEMKLVDDVIIKSNGDVFIRYHLTTSMCPATFAIEMAKNIVKRVSSINGVKSVKLRLENHYMADEINKLFG